MKNLSSLLAIKRSSDTGEREEEKQSEEVLTIPLARLHGCFFGELLKKGKLCISISVWVCVCLCVWVKSSFGPDVMRKTSKNTLLI